MYVCMIWTKCTFLQNIQSIDEFVKGLMLKSVKNEEHDLVKRFKNAKKRKFLRAERTSILGFRFTFTKGNLQGMLMLIHMYAYAWQSGEFFEFPGFGILT